MASAMLVRIFIIFFCSFFLKNKAEFQANADYSIANMSAEAENELFAVDDATCLFLLLFFMFALYFGFFAIVVDVNYMEFLPPPPPPPPRTSALCCFNSIIDVM
jgi:hypothetical protein